MGPSDIILQARKALKFLNETEESLRKEGLDLLTTVLKNGSPQLVEYGYDKLIMKELFKAAKFESPPNLITIFHVLGEHYAHEESSQDEILELLLYIYGLSTNFDVAKECIGNISRLIDRMNDNVAKHSKQIMQAAEVNSFISLNEEFIRVLEKLKKRLPARKSG